MTGRGDFEPAWDSGNHRFTVPSRCPYPDCTEPVAPTHAAAALAWCASCERPYEAIKVDQPKGGPIELCRRPRSDFCTYTGRRLAGRSLLDWCEAGGGPSRSNCPPDLRGAIFGPPDRQTAIRPVEDWIRDSIVEPPDREDAVIAVLVVRGWVVPVTARGRVGLLDAETGESCPDLEQPLGWPDASTDPTDISYSVQHPPAFRGTKMVIAAPHQAYFRDLRRFMMGVQTASEPRTVEPDSGSMFLGPPLGLDRREDQLFCLLQGRVVEAIQQPVLRFFTTDGEEVARTPCRAIARPPVYDHESRRVVWVEPDGAVSSLPVDRLGEADSPEPDSWSPAAKALFEPEGRPTLIVVPDANRGTELWLSSSRNGQPVLCTMAFDRTLSDPEAPWQWDVREYGRMGHMSGFAVGLGSRDRDNAAGELLGVATSEQVVLLQRFAGPHSTHPMQASEASGVRGSFDPPIVCSAGVVARLNRRLVLDNQGMGWSDDELHPEVAVPGEYGRSQGIAMFGRRVFIGHGLGVRSYLLELRRRGE